MEIFKLRRTFVYLMVVVMALSAFTFVPAAGTTVETVIVQAANVQEAAAAVEQFGGEVTSHFDLINSVAANLPASAVKKLAASSGIVSVTPNYQASITGLLENQADTKQISPVDFSIAVGADKVWQQGITGDGITVAIVDSGLAPFDSLLYNTNGQSRLVAWKDFVDGSLTPIDPQGHGTHMAGIILNAEANAAGGFNGVAPDANLVAVRVLDENGYGSLEQILNGILWVIQHQDEYNIKVMNLSLSSDAMAPYWADPINRAVMMAWANGITVITSAGNTGSGPSSISIPGNNPYVITVGTFTDAYTPTDWEDDYLAVFSGAGPTLEGFIKPDVIAPGAHMLSLMPADNMLLAQGETTHYSGDYYNMAGTSQSAAVVSGVAALILQQNPALTPDQLKHRLTSTAMPMIDISEEVGNAAYSIFQQGAGRVNAPDAVFTKSTEKANANLNIWFDLNNLRHYRGMATYNKANDVYHVAGIHPTSINRYLVWDGDYTQRTAGYGVWADGYGVWADGYGVWADGWGVWADGYGVWADGYGVWADGWGVWADGYGVWADGWGVWADGWGVWADGWGVWADGWGVWADGWGVWADGWGVWADGYGVWADGWGVWAD